MANKLSRTPCNITMELWYDGKKIVKHCSDMWQVYVFERDMPWKHGLQFTKKPHVIKTMYGE